MFLLSLLQSTTLIVAWRNPTLPPAMTTQRSLTNAFVAMVVGETQVSLQALWRFIAMVKGCDWGNQFYRECFGTFTIVKGCGPVTNEVEGIALVCVTLQCNHLPVVFILVFVSTKSIVGYLAGGSFVVSEMLLHC
jgi:hypothetical protein